MAGRGLAGGASYGRFRRGKLWYVGSWQARFARLWLCLVRLCWARFGEVWQARPGEVRRGKDGSVVVRYIIKKRKEL